MRRFRVVGPGRAGRAFSRSLEAAGWQVLPALARDDDLAGASAGVDLLLLSVPDGAVAKVAAAVAPVDAAVVAHCAGSLGLDALAPHVRVASIHPLVSLPSDDGGLDRLRGAAFAVAGDPLVGEVVATLGGRAFKVDDDRRVAYHAAAAVASNHLVALMGQVERIAAAAGVPLAAFLDLARGSLENVAATSPAAALTGPVARGDWETIAAHLAALPQDERPAYLAGATLAARLAARELPHPLPSPTFGESGRATTTSAKSSGRGERS